MNSPPSPLASPPVSADSSWVKQHTDLALQLLYAGAGVGFLASIALASLLKGPMLLGIIVGFAFVRGMFFVAERLGEGVFLDNIASGNFVEAVRGPGISKAKQVQTLRREVSDRANRPAAERAAAFVSYYLDAEGSELASVARQFEDVWGVPPVAGADDSLIRRLLDGGFRFTIAVNAPPEEAQEADVGIPWKILWKDRLWSQLCERHPGEPLRRLLLRLYASEWQKALAPVWVVAAILASVVLSNVLPRPHLSPLPRAILFYSAGAILGASAIWLAFILRPEAFNASLMANDMDRCALWVLESTEGKHFLTASMGSHRPELRQQAVRLLIWNDILLNADVTLPEGMKAYCRREGTTFEKKRRSGQESGAASPNEQTRTIAGPGV